MDDPSRYIVRLCRTSQAFNVICSDPETWRLQHQYRTLYLCLLDIISISDGL